MRPSFSDPKKNGETIRTSPVRSRLSFDGNGTAGRNRVAAPPCWRHVPTLYASSGTTYRHNGTSGVGYSPICCRRYHTRRSLV